MSAYPSLPLFTDAFIADTGHLSAQETGAYLMLMMVAWRSPECRLPDTDDKLARWARVDRRTWLRIKPAVMEFWTLADGFWSQKRLSKEREFVSKRAEVNRRNGEQGGRPKSLKNNDTQNPAGSVRVSETKAPNPTPTPREEDTSYLPLENMPARRHAWPSDYRDQVWERYGKKVDKAPGMAALDGLHRADRVGWTEFIDGIDRQARSVEPKFRPSLERFIKRQKWTDQQPEEEARNGSGSPNLFPGQPADRGHQRSSFDAIAAGLAVVAGRRGLGPGARPDGDRPENSADRGPGADDPEIEDAEWSPARGYRAAHH